MNKIFDLEQEIMECWNVTSDLQLILDCYDGLSDDSLLNLLIGMKEMYQLRFDKMFRTFEEMVAERKESLEIGDTLHFADYDTMMKNASYTYEDESPYYVANTAYTNMSTIDLTNIPDIKVSVSPYPVV